MMNQEEGKGGWEENERNGDGGCSGGRRDGGGLLCLRGFGGQVVGSSSQPSRGQSTRLTMYPIASAVSFMVPRLDRARETRLPHDYITRVYPMTRAAKYGIPRDVTIQGKL